MCCEHVVYHGAQATQQRVAMPKSKRVGGMTFDLGERYT
jgi:hypothetical protein